MQTIIYAFTDIDRFTDRCRRVYFATDDPSEGTFIIVNAGLASLYFEAAVNASDPAERARYDACRAMCARNLEIALGQLNLMMPATLENIEALLMGVSSSESIIYLLPFHINTQSTFLWRVGVRSERERGKKKKRVTRSPPVLSITRSIPSVPREILIF